MSVRAKVRCVSIRRKLAYGQHDGEEQHEVTLQPVYGDSPENKTWSKSTPGGEIKLDITNPEAVGQFELGKAYFVDFTPAE